MKYIEKKSSWVAPKAINYDSLCRNRAHKQTLRSHLVQEQGYICAYTMLRISDTQGSIAHIEHYEPQCDLTDAQTLDYGNLLACYKETPHQTPFGEARKENYNPHKNPFLNPQDRACESELQFKDNGEVVGLSANALATIDILKLNAPELILLRLRVLEGEGLSNSADFQLTPQELAFRKQNALAQDDMGKFAPFCIAIHQVAQKFIPIS